MKTIYINLETGSSGTNQIGASQVFKNTPTEKCSFTPSLNPINREGYRLPPCSTRVTSRPKNLFGVPTPNMKTGFQAALAEINSKKNAFS